MPKAGRHVTDFIIAASLAAAILYTTMLAARWTADSSFYRQSRIISMLVRQDSVGVAELLEDRRNLDMVLGFAGALTAAYINFELIPLNEAPTFVAVFESLPDGVTVESFEYRRKDLYITGSADTNADYQSFVSALREQGRFSSVTGGGYESTSGDVTFEVVCSSAAS